MDNKELLLKHIALNQLLIDNLIFLQQKVTKSNQELEDAFNDIISNMHNSELNKEVLLNNIKVDLEETMKYLQFEDYMHQSFDGLINLLNNEKINLNLNENDLEKIKKLKQETIKNYIIQEQRDIANGNKPELECENSGELDLF